MSSISDGFVESKDFRTFCRGVNNAITKHGHGIELLESSVAEINRGDYSHHLDQLRKAIDVATSRMQVRVTDVQNSMKQHQNTTYTVESSLLERLIRMEDEVRQLRNMDQVRRDNRGSITPAPRQQSGIITKSPKHKRLRVDVYELPNEYTPSQNSETESIHSLCDDNNDNDDVQHGNASDNCHVEDEEDEDSDPADEALVPTSMEGIFTIGTREDLTRPPVLPAEVLSEVAKIVQKVQVKPQWDGQCLFGRGKRCRYPEWSHSGGNTRLRAWSQPMTATLSCRPSTNNAKSILHVNETCPLQSVRETRLKVLDCLSRMPGYESLRGRALEPLSASPTVANNIPHCCYSIAGATEVRFLQAHNINPG
ncbi:hypothetical protein BU24DRAFT_475103 [Aaosphaeria arxii CBS 175.79]|uniref:Uncharacterized protein n=1 Tax=Aaosphaeria arxii CBS 175.79 TaxID=1450172 RepID=A0A6A5X776_9PLEO|nr:uncharacterized protein BU24DRAFT_475103 [Aaosphaeria arxii CBS 175.79]KAF2008644.1 hypothetical protein BU24DRAFT_475103 [Aaosphaeria arxii CBS 175.79]